MSTAGSSREFTGGTVDNINWGDLTDLDGATQITMGCWANFDGIVDFSGNYMISKWASFVDMSYSFGVDNNRLEFMLRNNTGANACIINHDVALNTILSANTWYWLSSTFDYNGGSSISKIYIDSVSKTINTRFGDPNLVSSIRNSVGSHRIGTIGAAAFNMGGRLAYIHVYDRALSQEEIEELHFKPGSIGKNLIYYQPLNDTVSSDLAGNAGNGTNTGTVLSLDGPPVFIN